MKINKYPDGTSYIKITQGKDYFFPTKYTFRVNTYEDLWHLNQLIDACNSEKIVPTITIPNLIDAQADRRFFGNESSGLKLVCGFLNSMNANFRIFHPHNPEVVEALMNNVEIIDNSEFINKVLLEGLIKDSPSMLDSGIINDNLTLMSSDAGGFKPLMKLCNKINWSGETFSASKYRMPHNKLISDRKNVIVQRIDKEDFEGKDILIIDDICVYGGTFKGLSKLLRKRNCGNLYLAVSHMTVQNLGTDPVTNYFDKVFSTNSKFNNYYEDNDNRNISKTFPKNLEILKMFDV